MNALQRPLSSLDVYTPSTLPADARPFAGQFIALAASNGQLTAYFADGSAAWKPAAGAPSGGTTAQVLTKNSGADGDYSWQTISGAGLGDASTNTSSSVDGVMAVFSSTTGKVLRQLALSGLMLATAGVMSAAVAGTNYSAGTAALATGILKSTTTTGALTIAVAGDFPTLNQDTTGVASNISGTATVAHGGTGLTTLTAHGVMLGAGTGNVVFATPGSAGQLLISNGGTSDPTFQAIPTWNQNTTGTAAGLSSALAIGSGGTGQATANAGLNALLPSQTSNSGKVLSTDGTNTSWVAQTGGGGSVATDTIWTTAGDLAVGTGSHTAVRLAIGTSLQVLQVNSGATALQWVTLSGGGNALTSNPLSQFVATTSAQFAGVISDETGSGLVVFNNAPTFIAPVLGTIASGNLAAGTGYTLANLAGLGSNVGTFLATPSSANLFSAMSTKTGSGGNLVFSIGPSITGVVTTDGANINTAAAITITSNAGSVDVSKGVSTGTDTGATTYTFTGTPATDQWFSVIHTNSAGTTKVITFPSAYSQVTQAARTTCPVPAGGNVCLLFRYQGSSTYSVFGDSPYFNNFAATVDPAVTDDVASGYGPGSLWLNATSNVLWICETNGSGAAVWDTLAGGGSGTVTHTGGSLTANALLLGAGTADTKVVPGFSTDGTSVLTLGVAGTSVGKIAFTNATSGTQTIQPATGALGAGVWTLQIAPGSADSLVGRATTDTLTNKSIDAAQLTGTVSVNRFNSGTSASSTTYLDGTGAWSTPAGGSFDALQWKQPVIAATTAAITLSTGLVNGTVLDGVTLSTNDRALVKNQATQSENGIYIVPASGAPTRATDMDVGSEFVSAIVYVGRGTTQGDRVFVCGNDATVTVGSTNINFGPFNGISNAVGKTFTINNSLSMSGTDGKTFTLNASTTISGTDGLTLTTFGSTTLPVFTQQITFSGPTAARTITLPDAAFTVARTDAGQIFTGTQAFGAITYTTLNGNTWASGTGTLSIGAGKTFTASETMTFTAGAASLTFTMPPISASIGYLGVPLGNGGSALTNSNYTVVLNDRGCKMFRTAAATTAITITIPANATLAFASGDLMAFENDFGSTGNMTISCSDTISTVGSAGTTGNIVLLPGQKCFLEKTPTTTRWRATVLS